LQARHGERLDEGDWRVLEGAKSLDHHLDRSRATSLRRFTDRLEARMSSHAIERVLRAEWRRYVAETAAWVPPVWRPAVRWLRHVPDLPMLELLRQGDAPEWVRQDPTLAAHAERDPQKRVTGHEDPSALLSLANTGTLAHWLTHWRALWPPLCGVDCQWLDRLCTAVAEHLGRLTTAGVQETSARYRGDLAQAVTRLFRRRSGTPVALFAHLTLVALDLERLRGGLVRRQLFAAESMESAA
jgi:hypothetical protein